jgi:hypothetical protein
MIRNTVIVHGLNQMHDGYVPSLAVDPLTAHFPVEGGIRGTAVQVSVNVADPTQSWGVVCSAAWFNVTGASLAGDDTFDINCDPQPAGAQPPRSGTVTVSSTDCADKIINVSQDARAG